MIAFIHNKNYNYYATSNSTQVNATKISDTVILKSPSEANPTRNFTKFTYNHNHIPSTRTKIHKLLE